MKRAKGNPVVLLVPGSRPHVQSEQPQNMAVSLDSSRGFFHFLQDTERPPSAFPTLRLNDIAPTPWPLVRSTFYSSCNLVFSPPWELALVLQAHLVERARKPQSPGPPRERGEMLHNVSTKGSGKTSITTDS